MGKVIAQSPAKNPADENEMSVDVLSSVITRVEINAKRPVWRLANRYARAVVTLLDCQMLPIAKRAMMAKKPKKSKIGIFCFSKDNAMKNSWCGHYV